MKGAFGTLNLDSPIVVAVFAVGWRYPLVGPALRGGGRAAPAASAGCGAGRPEVMP
jgi:hypothetical protein